MESNRNKHVIKIKDLKLIVEEIFNHISNNLKKDEIEITKDFYWEIPEECLYDFKRDPNNFTMGNLFDDLEFLKPLLADPEQATPLMLLHVAPLLRYLAFEASVVKT